MDDDLRGAGDVGGHLRLDQGKLLPGTDLTVAARELSLSLLSHRAVGSGSIKIDVTAEEPEALDLVVQFDTLHAFHEKEDRPLFSGEGLAVSGSGGTTMQMLQGGKSTVNRLSLTVPVVKVSDLAVYQRYVPKKWQFKLHGGVGELNARAELLKTSFSADLSLKSEEADVGVKDYRFSTDLDLGIKFDNPSFASGLVDISGTYIRLGDSKLASEQHGKSELIQTELVVTKGQLELQLPELENADASVKELSEVLKQHDLNTLLAAANAELEIDGTMSDLSWMTWLSAAPGSSSFVHWLMQVGRPRERWLK